jgi:hypothetical protein
VEHPFIGCLGHYCLFDEQLEAVREVLEEAGAYLPARDDGQLYAPPVLQSRIELSLYPENYQEVDQEEDYHCDDLDDNSNEVQHTWSLQPVREVGAPSAYCVEEPVEEVD